MRFSILVVLALFITLRPMIPIIEYVANYKYVSTVLCINKDKPQMHCDGKCHLKKNLKKTFEDESAPSSDKIQLLTEWIMLFLNHTEIIDLSQSLEAPLQHASCLDEHYHFQFTAEIPHPPTFA